MRYFPLCFRLLLGLLVLLAPVNGVGTNLLVNGDWKMCPPFPNPPPTRQDPDWQINVAGSLRFFKTGDPLLPGWKLSGKGGVFYWKDGRRHFHLLGKSTMSQVITTTPGKVYRVELRLQRNDEGRATQHIDVLFGESRGRIDPTTEFRPASYTLTFKATERQTNVVLKANNGNDWPASAPYLFLAAVYSADPAEERATPWFTNTYNTVAKGYERNERQTVMGIYNDSFQGTTEGGASFSKADLSSALDGVLDKEPSSTAVVSELTLSDDGGTADVIVSQRVNSVIQDGTGRHRHVAITGYRDRWLKDGESWKLESRKLLSRKLQVDGKDIKSENPPPAYP